jgi:hypothetical protein
MPAKQAEIALRGVSVNRKIRGACRCHPNAEASIVRLETPGLTGPDGEWKRAVDLAVCPVCGYANGYSGG